MAPRRPLATSRSLAKDESHPRGLSPVDSKSRSRPPLPQPNPPAGPLGEADYNHLKASSGQPPLVKIPSKDLSTLAVHAGDRKKPGDFTPSVTPIHTASSFFYDSIEQLGEVFEQQAEGSVYTRFGNPTSGAFEGQMAGLEGADYAVATASGMAGLNLALTAALTDRRRSIVAADCIYGQTIAMLMKIFEPQGVDVRFADVCDLERFEAVVEEEKPGVVLLETMTNPLVRVPQLDRVSEIARKHGAWTLVDATFTTPVLMRPLEWGADLVIHSVTKYIAGHGDVLGGVVLGKDDTREIVEYLYRTLGPNLGPFTSFLAMRGAKTLPLRMERQCRNAQAVAEALSGVEGVERVYHPSRQDHPDYEVAKRFFPEGLSGAVVSFDLEGGRPRALAFLNALEMILPSTSVGDVHTMALYPPMSTHRDLSPKHRARLGIGEGLIRLSVGIESPDDVIADVLQAVRASQPAPTTA